MAGRGAGALPAPPHRSAASGGRPLFDEEFGSGSAGGAGAMEREVKKPSTTDHLRAALASTTETQELGIATLEELEAQREQLQRIQRKVDEVEAHADRGTFIMKGMKSVFGGLKNKFSKKPDAPKDVIDKREKERLAKLEAVDAELERRAAAREARDASRSGGATGAGGKGVASVSDAKVLRDARIAEEDALLEQISRNLTGIKAIGHAMGDELSRHDGIIDELTTSMDRTTGKIDKVRSEADRLAGRRS